MNQSPNNEKRSQILDAAQKRFAYYGFNKVTMDEIAVDLGISKAALYYYFKTKEEIFRDVIAREQGVYISLTETIVNKDATPAAKLREYCCQRLHYFNELANLKLIGIQVWIDVKPIISDLFKVLSLHEHTCIASILNQGKQSDEFYFASSEKTAQVVMHTLRGITHHFVKTFNDTTSFAERFKTLQEETDLLVDLLLNGLTNKPR